jgi:hypothetical protein
VRPGGGQDHPPGGRVPWWRVLLLWVDELLRAAWRPFPRMWHSQDPVERFSLVQLGSAAGDALVAVALADSIFFSIPVGQAEGKVAAYLLLTMAPLAVAGPLLVPVLDRAGPRRWISLASAAARAFLALIVAPRIHGFFLFPGVFLILVCSRVQAITKNGLVLAYVGPGEGLVRSNARLGRAAIVGAALAALPGIALLKLAGAGSVLDLAALVYATTALVNFRLPHPRLQRREEQTVERLGRLPSLRTPTLGVAGLRAANGFLVFLLAFALRRGGQPVYWYGAVLAAALIGGFLADVLAPRLPQSVREEVVLIACVIAAAISALLAFEAFVLPVLAIVGLLLGAATEFGRLAFQSLMQRNAPVGALGRVFVRYEVVFQLSWVAGALLAALVPIDFRGGMLLLAVFYAVVGLSYLLWPGASLGGRERPS